MRAIGYKVAGKIGHVDSLEDISLPDPQPGPRDLRVRVKAISINPADVETRAAEDAKGDEWKVLGWDVAGTVDAVGEKVERFRPGDEVFYAGAVDRQGGNMELHLVDERIVGHKPSTLGWPEAAALPLTSLVSWEALFERLEVTRAVPGAANAVLVIGGSGGVGSIALQLLRARTDLIVIATASDDKTSAWAKKMGAHHVINHLQPLVPQVEALGLEKPGFVFSTTHTDQHLSEIAELIAPQGRFGLIDDFKHFDLNPFKYKSVSVHFTLMYTRSLYQTPDMGEQGRILDEVAGLADAGTIATTMTELLSPIDAATLKRAHAMVERGIPCGKLVVRDFAAAAS